MKAKWEIHSYYPAQYQTSVYDYEGWAHPYPEGWQKREFEGTHKEALAQCRHPKDYVTALTAGLRQNEGGA